MGLSAAWQAVHWLSHQSAVLNRCAPQPGSKDRVGTAFLNYYAPATRHYGFHFLDYDTNIFTPIIRDGVRAIRPTQNGHYTVYLPAYSDKLITSFLLHFPEIQWEVFSKHTKKITEEQNIFIRPIHDNLFLQSMASANGVLCGAGFETPAEALFLKKKFLVVPMKGQYEQHCNAAALKSMGVPVIKDLKLKYLSDIDNWLERTEGPEVAYPDNTAAIVAQMFKDFEWDKAADAEAVPEKKFKKSTFQKIVAAYISI